MSFRNKKIKLYTCAHMPVQTTAGLYTPYSRIFDLLTILGCTVCLTAYSWHCRHGKFFVPDPDTKKIQLFNLIFNDDTVGFLVGLLMYRNQVLSARCW